MSLHELDVALDVGPVLFCLPTFWNRSGTVPERFRIRSETSAVLERFWSGSRAVLERFWSGSRTVMERLWNGSGTKQKGIEPTQFVGHE